MKRALVIFALAALALPAVATASYPGRNGKLVFFQADIGGVDPVGLAVADADGRNQTPEPVGPACGGEGETRAPGPCPVDPVWSPDGRRIAFALGDELVTMLTDGSDQRRLSFPGLTRVGSPTWSPDNRLLGFSALAAGRRNVWTALADGSDPRRLTTMGGSAPTWSTQNEIAFVREGNLLVMRPRTAGAGARRVTSGGGSDSPSWGPGGSALAFVRDVRLTRGSRRVTSVLHRVGSDGRGLLRLTNRRSEDPAWTPDGSRVMFTRSDGFDFRILSVGARRGRGERVVTAGFEGRRVAALSADQQPLP